MFLLPGIISIAITIGFINLIISAVFYWRRIGSYFLSERELRIASLMILFLSLISVIVLYIIRYRLSIEMKLLSDAIK